MAIRPRWATGRWSALIAVAAIPLMLSGILIAAPGDAASTAPAGVQSAPAKVGHVAAGTVVHAATSKTPFVPTAAQRAARARDMKMLASLKKAPIGPHTTAADVATLRGPQTSLTQSQAPGDFSI